MQTQRHHQPERKDIQRGDNAAQRHHIQPEKFKDNAERYELRPSAAHCADQHSQTQRAINQSQTAGMAQRGTKRKKKAQYMPDNRKSGELNIKPPRVFSGYATEIQQDSGVAHGSQLGNFFCGNSDMR